MSLVSKRAEVFYSVLVRDDLIFHTLAGARILLVYWRHYCHFLSLSFLNLPNPELRPFVETIFCLPALRAVCQIMCKRSNPLPPALDTGWGNEEEWSYWFHFGGQGGSFWGRSGVWRANAAVCYPYFFKQTKNPNNYSCCWIGNTSQNSWQKEQEDNRWTVRRDYIYTLTYITQTQTSSFVGNKVKTWRAIWGSSLSCPKVGHAALFAW